MHDSLKIYLREIYYSLMVDFLVLPQIILVEERGIIV